MPPAEESAASGEAARRDPMQIREPLSYRLFNSTVPPQPLCLLRWSCAMLVAALFFSRRRRRVLLKPNQAGGWRTDAASAERRPRASLMRSSTHARARELAFAVRRNQRTANCVVLTRTVR